MSAYSGAENSSYPHHPHPHTHAQIHQQAAQSNDPLSHHSLPQISQSYQYDPQHAPQQQQQQIYNNGHANGHAEQVQHSPVTPASGGPETPKGNRLRKACDSCSIRKVKCDEAGPPCKACAALDIPCTFQRPSRRRGPPNRHAEEIKEREKRRKLEDSQQASPSISGFSSPTSPSGVVASLVSLSSQLNAESICPLNTLELLIDDFFTYIHPLAPLPHEPSFRAAFKHREDLSNPGFLALLASMVGVLVASFPRRPRLHLKNQQRQNMFPSSMSLVERCHKISVEARGTGYLDRDLSVYDACTSYFLGLASGYMFQWKLCRLYFGETLNIARVLGAHKTDNAGFLGVGGLPATFGADLALNGQNQPIAMDYIRQEISRRVFWIMFVGIRSMQQLGATFGELLIPPPTPREPYPPLPMEVDDEYIYVDHIDRQPDGVLSKLAGFNMGIQIYQTLTPLATMEMAYGIDQVFDWNRQKKVLEDALRNVKSVLLSTPRELLLQPNPQSGQYEPTDRQYYPPMIDYPGVRSNGNDMAQWVDADARRKLQYEIQKANIYASQLGTRSYIVEKYWNMHEAYEQMKANNGGASQLSSPGLMATGLDDMLPKSSTSDYDGIETIVASEWESIVKDLLRVLSSISQVNMEPNAGSFINKIRQIASTLIDTPQNRKGPLALKSEECLGRFLDVLMKLERISPGVRSESADGVVDEEEELRNWADLREYQMRFAQSGGFLVD